MLPVHLSNNRESNLDIKHELLSILDEILSLNGRAASFKEDTPLLGAIPELDSMAVVALITTIEERFGVAMEDDEIDGSIFATVGSLTGFVQSKLAT
jgi:acyl carrier protein